MRRPITPKRFNKRNNTLQKAASYFFNVDCYGSTDKLRTAFSNGLNCTEKYTLSADFDACVQRALQREKKKK